MIRQFTQDIHIWSHQRYSDPPALAPPSTEGFTAIRKWAMQFYPDGRGGSAADLRRARCKSEGSHTMNLRSAYSRWRRATSAPR